jgi:hypothetical protein
VRSCVAAIEVPSTTSAELGVVDVLSTCADAELRGSTKAATATLRTIKP